MKYTVLSLHVARPTGEHLLPARSLFILFWGLAPAQTLKHDVQYMYTQSLTYYPYGHFTMIMTSVTQAFVETLHASLPKSHVDTRPGDPCSPYSPLCPLPVGTRSSLITAPSPKVHVAAFLLQSCQPNPDTHVHPFTHLALLPSLGVRRAEGRGAMWIHALISQSACRVHRIIDKPCGF